MEVADRGELALDPLQLFVEQALLLMRSAAALRLVRGRSDAGPGALGGDVPAPPTPDGVGPHARVAPDLRQELLGHGEELVGQRPLLGIRAIDEVAEPGGNVDVGGQ